MHVVLQEIIQDVHYSKDIIHKFTVCKIGFQYLEVDVGLNVFGQTFIQDKV